MSTIIAEVVIEGTRPLLFHVFGPEALPLEKQEKSGVAGHDPNEWHKTYTATKEGQLYLRPDYIFGCLVNGARYTKRGRGTAMSAAQATLQILDESLLLDRYMPEGDMPINEYDSPVYLDIRGARNPSTKGRAVRYRVACSPGWKTTFRATFDGTVIGRNEFEAIVRDAGVFVGLGDGRSIGMGRYALVSCTFDE